MARGEGEETPRRVAASLEEQVLRKRPARPKLRMVQRKQRKKERRRTLLGKQQ
jgi:hypothetical protein